MGERLNVIDDYAEDQFATFLNTKLAADVPANDAGDRVVVHTLTPATPGAPASGTAEGRENAHLRVRLNGEWYETALDNVKTDENGMAWESLTGTNPTYCDASYQLGRRADGSKSHAAKNLFLGETTDYQYARISVQVHIGTHLGSRSDHTVTAPTPGAAQNSGNGGTPILWMRVNGTWRWMDISDYVGINGDWVTCPIDMSLLRGGQENYFGLTTNVVSYGNFTDSSVDFYATRVEEGFNSFLTNDPYSDNNFAQYQDRNINLVLEFYDGSQWVRVPSGESYAYDEYTVLGLFGDNNTWYNAARNLVLGDLSRYSQARLRVQMHIGNKLTVQDNPYVCRRRLGTARFPQHKRSQGKSGREGRKGQ